MLECCIYNDLWHKEAEVWGFLDKCNTVAMDHLLPNEARYTVKEVHIRKIVKNIKTIKTIKTIRTIKPIKPIFVQTSLNVLGNRSGRLGLPHTFLSLPRDNR